MDRKTTITGSDYTTSGFPITPLREANRLDHDLGSVQNVLGMYIYWGEKGSIIFMIF